MEFADAKCLHCGRLFRDRKPENVHTAGAFNENVVAPCPFCGEDVPLFEPANPAKAEAKAEPAPEPEPEAEPTTE